MTPLELSIKIINPFALIVKYPIIELDRTTISVEPTGKPKLTLRKKDIGTKCDKDNGWANNKSNGKILRFMR